MLEIEKVTHAGSRLGRVGNTSRRKPPGEKAPANKDLHIIKAENGTEEGFVVVLPGRGGFAVSINECAVGKNGFAKGKSLFVKGENGTAKGKSLFVKRERGSAKGKSLFVKRERGSAKGKSLFVKRENRFANGETGMSKRRSRNNAGFGRLLKKLNRLRVLNQCKTNKRLRCSLEREQHPGPCNRGPAARWLKKVGGTSKMANDYKTVEKRLQETKVLIENVGQDELKAPLAVYGYDETRFNAGNILWNIANLAAEKKTKLYAKYREATRALNAQAAKVESVYLVTLALAKLRIEGEELEIKDFGVEGSGKRALATWTTEAKNFYKIAMEPEKVVMMEYFGKTAGKLQGELSMVLALDALLSKQKDAKGLAQASTQERDKAIKVLEKWCKDLVKVCKIAHADNPQHLERLGQIIYTPGYTPKGIGKGDTPTPDPGTGKKSIANRSRPS